jgi:YebC/PmpR family DNA-binding regulatory protein
MAGHSHWANIARKKAVIDNKRGKLWSKLSKAIIVAAKMGGGDADMNLRLRYAIDAAKAVSMPKENIQRAIKSGIGALDGTNFEDLLYEGYGPGGVAILCEILTDNRNRTAGEIRKIFELADGKLGATGCVAWMFDRKGLFLVPADKAEEDKLLDLALDAGAEDVKRVDDKFEITCDPGAIAQVSAALETHGIPVEVKEIARIPTSYVDLDAQTAPKVLALMERLDDHDDVQNVASNFNIPQEALTDSKN